MSEGSGASADAVAAGLAAMQHGRAIEATITDAGVSIPPEGEIDLGDLAPAWLGAMAKLIRPLCVGALMAIPTIGAASVGLVAIFSPSRALAMAEASTRFLGGIPGEIVALIAFLAGGYTVARSAEKIVGGRRQ